jgi:hypothetical protein
VFVGEGDVQGSAGASLSKTRAEEKRPDGDILVFASNSAQWPPINVIDFLWFAWYYTDVMKHLESPWRARFMV